MFFFHFAVNIAWKLAMFVNVEYIVKARCLTDVTSNIFTFYEQKIHPPGSSKSEQKTKQLVFSLKWRKENNIFKNKVCFKVFQPLHWLVKKEMPFQKTALSRSLLKKWALV